MSYDLYLYSESNPLTEQQFDSYFSGRPHYELNEGQAFYQNNDTGVYFDFSFGEDHAQVVSFNINFFRPHFFGLEAAPEIDAFVKTFDLSIEDPQSEGMEDGTFSVDGFLRGWNAGNRFAHRAFLTSETPPETQVYPTAGLERIWRWNFNRRRRQDQVGDDLFVPALMFMTGGSAPRTAVVWPDASPIYMPKADLVFIIRDELAVNPMPEGEYESTFVEWADVAAVVEQFPYDEKAGFYRLDYETPPDRLVDFVRSVTLQPRDHITGISFDNVLNAELVAEYT